LFAERHHDIVFLRAYIHDATFETSKIHLSGEFLRIPLQRDRWKRHKHLESSNVLPHSIHRSRTGALESFLGRFKDAPKTLKKENTPATRVVEPVN
jgi:hypothetical protein